VPEPAAGVPKLIELFSNSKRHAAADGAPESKRPKPTAATSVRLALKLEPVRDF
jgi:hypothetical protein